MLYKTTLYDPGSLITSRLRIDEIHFTEHVSAIFSKIWPLPSLVKGVISAWSRLVDGFNKILPILCEFDSQNRNKKGKDVLLV
jgi:hypothetical protein